MFTSGVFVLSLFIVELVSLFFLSRGITSSISYILYKISHSQKFTIVSLAILFLPGTIIHELSHIIMAGICLVHVGEMDFLPQSSPEGVRLGSAEIGLTDPFRRALIGVAPLPVLIPKVVSKIRRQQLPICHQRRWRRLR